MFFFARMYGSNELWLEITNVDTTSQLAYLLAHNTTNAFKYQLLSNTNLSATNDWIPGEIRFGDSTANQTFFNPVSIGDNPMMFFLAHQALATLSIAPVGNAIEPNSAQSDPGQAGLFNISNDGTQAVTAYYTISGTASNGVDYTNQIGRAHV